MGFFDPFDLEMCYCDSARILNLSELKDDLAHPNSDTVANTFMKLLLEILSLLYG